MNEFDCIEKVLSPLAEKADGALGLTDDGAILSLGTNINLVVTSDALVEGTHFMSSLSPEKIARRALRVNLSDLAAMGAKPLGYNLTLALGKNVDDAWVQSFAAGLAKDQEKYNIQLFGGDTVRTPNETMISICAYGRTKSGEEMTRNRSMEGDHIFVTGTIGDACLGFKILNGTLDVASEEDRVYLIGRFEKPTPRLMESEMYAPYARAAVDVSDGLVADLSHICRFSNYLQAYIKLSKIPLSQPAQRVLEALSPDEREALLLEMITFGDDYELILTVPPSYDAEPSFASKLNEMPMTLIGHMGAVIDHVPEDSKYDVELVHVYSDINGPLKIKNTGYKHQWHGS